MSFIKQQGFVTGNAGGGGNATVPGDAPVQPPQAYVNMIPQLIRLSGLDAPEVIAYVPFTAMGITRFDATDPILAPLLYHSDINELNLCDNAIPTEDVDALLSKVLSYGNFYSVFLNGGTNGIPTGGWLSPDLLTLVESNVSGSLAINVPGGSFIIDPNSNLLTAENCATNVEEIDTLLEALANSTRTFTGFTMVLSGPDMAVPTLGEAWVAGHAEIEIPVGYVTGELASITFGGGVLFKVILDDSIDMIDSFQSGQDVTIGIMDSPSVGDIAAKVVTVYSDPLVGTMSVAGAIITIQTSFANGEYLLLSDETGTATLLNAGSHFVKSPLVTAILNAHGGQITVMEYVDRISGAKEAVTY